MASKSQGKGCRLPANLRRTRFHAHRTGRALALLWHCTPDIPHPTSHQNADQLSSCTNEDSHPILQAFFFDVVSKTEAVACKHQLAARLADALGKTRVQTVSDAALAHLLQD